MAAFGLDELHWAADVFVADLPEGGYRYTAIGGIVVQAGAELTGARPGPGAAARALTRLSRGPPRR